MRWAGLVARDEERRDALALLVRQSKGNKATWKA